MFWVPPECLQRILLTLHQTHTPQCPWRPTILKDTFRCSNPANGATLQTLLTYPNSEAFLDLLSEPQRTSLPLDQLPKPLWSLLFPFRP
ncbi:hypothetical protein CRENBAI_006019 [Crenichthys baileyi]|uniref:F-box domain-containing protein n=1 Tax=Crenichthys baileyi TaxID=28760 RepID=A0AAV9SF26_9TELE